MHWKAYGSRVRIDILHVPACPNLERAVARLHEALEIAAVAASVHHIEVATAESAAEVGMRGSPTILIEGVDAFSSGSAEPSLSCRLFHTPNGLDGAPTVAQLIDAVTR